jgi:hypothetical protein
MLAFFGSSANLRMCSVVPMMTIDPVYACVTIGLLFSNINVTLNLVPYNYVPNRCDYNYDKICRVLGECINTLKLMH